MVGLRGPGWPGSSMFRAGAGARGHIYQKARVLQMFKVNRVKVRTMGSECCWFDVAGFYGILADPNYVAPFFWVRNVPQAVFEAQEQTELVPGWNSVEV